MFRAASRLAMPAALLMTALVATACVAPAGAANPTASPATPKDPDAVVIRVDWEGGFVPPSVLVSRLPILLVTADGRVITQGPQIEIYPGPLLPNVQVRQLAPGELDKLIAFAKAQGLLKDAAYDFPGIADAATTVLRITVDGTTYTVSAYSLAEAGVDDATGMPVDDATREGRAALRTFIDHVTGLGDDAFTGPSTAYVADGYRVIASPFVPGPADDWQPVEWPLAPLATAGDPVVPGDDSTRCHVLSGADLAKVMPLFENANQLTPFTSGDAQFILGVRPLLPGETGC